MSTIFKGKIKLLFVDSGYGFIEIPGEKEDVHFNSDGCPEFKSLKRYDRVQFELDTSKEKDNNFIGINVKKTNEEPEIRTGKVKCYFESRGFGFVTTDDEENDVFFHIKNSSLNYFSTGEKVKFQLEKNQRGDVGINLEIIKDDKIQEKE